MKKMNNEKVLIVGVGKIGSQLGIRLQCQGIEVHGIRRQTDLIPQEITPIKADLNDVAHLSSLQAALKKRWSAVVYVVAAASFDEEAYQRAYVQGLAHLLQSLDLAQVGHLFFVSSSAVYGQDDGSWVDETSPTEPRGFNGNAMLQGEQLALATAKATVVRFSGIYGPQRTRLIDQVRAGRMSAAEPVVYSNRIHETDSVGILEFLIIQHLQGRVLDDIYIGSDCQPATMFEVQRWLASRIGVATDEVAPSNRQASERRAGSKRLSNQRLLAAGYDFVYPDYQSGYGALLDSERPGQ